MHRTVLVIAALVVLTPIAGVAGGATPAPAAAASVDAAESSYDGVINTSNESIGIWKSTALPLRADSDAGATKAQGQNVLIKHWEDEQRADARYSQLAVYDNDATIPLGFSDVTGADVGQFSDDEASVIVGKFTGDADAETALSAAPSSVAELKDMFGEDRLAEVNDNVTFAEVDTTELTADGEFESEFTPTSVEAFGDGVGQYVVLAAVSENDNTAPTLVDGENNLTPQDDAVIVGTDALIVHETTSDVTVDDAEPGDSVTFDVTDAKIGNGGDVHHAAALYHKDTVAQSGTVFNLTAPVDEDFTTDDVIVEPDIGTVNGVSDLDDGIPMFGDAAANASHSGTVTVPQMVEFLEGELNTTAPEVDPGDTTLDASVVSLADGDVSEELTVETFGNWTEGKYQWVHVAATQDGALATSAGEVTIEEDSGGGGGIPPAPPAPGEPDISLVDTGLSSAKVSPGESFEISATYENAGDGSGLHVVDLTRDGQTVDSETINLGAGAEETVTFTQSIDDPGSYEYAVDGSAVGTVDVSSKEAAFETSNADLSDTDVSVGDSVDVTATVENTGDATGTHTAELVIDGETVDTTEVTLEPGASDTAEFSHTFDEAGEYEVSVDDVTAGTVSVDDDGGDGIPGFGPVAALLGLAATLLIARTRSN